MFPTLKEQCRARPGETVRLPLATGAWLLTLTDEISAAVRAMPPVYGLPMKSASELLAGAGAR